MADADLDLDAADSAAGALTHGDRDVVAMNVEGLRLDRELIEDLQLDLDRAPDLVESAVMPPSRD